MKKYSIVNEEDLIDIYNNEVEINNLKDKHIVKYRTKTIKSGDVLECEVYPIWNCNNEVRKSKEKVSSIHQRNLNHRNTVKKCIRLMNVNFTDNDTYATLTYDKEHLPLDYDDAQKEMKNYIRRLKRYAVKQGIELKYIFTTEQSKKGRLHHHLVVNLNDRNKIEDLWHNSQRNNTKRLRADYSGYEGVARYICKEQKSTQRKTYCCSRNLKKPKITISDYKISKRQAFNIAAGKINPFSLFQKLYPGYSYSEHRCHGSEYIDGCYIYIKMHKIRI